MLWNHGDHVITVVDGEACLTLLDFLAERRGSDARGARGVPTL